MQSDLKVRSSSVRHRLSQVEEQFRHWQVESHHGRGGGRSNRTNAVRFVTISREYGCAGFRIADRLADALNGRAPADSPPWTVYDRKLVDMVCADHKLNRVLVNSLDAQRKHAFGDLITGMFTGEPSTLQVFRNIAETVFQLAVNGRVILIGRGGSVITSRLTGGLHVRIVAPLDWRVKQVAAFERLDDIKACRRHVETADRERGRFARDFLDADLKDPHNYDLVFNQQRLGVDSIVDLVLRAILLREGAAEPQMNTV